MSSTLAESPMRSKIKERRRISEVVSDLLASSQQVQTPVGLITLVDTRFLCELNDVATVTGEHLFAVVDAQHLARTAMAAGVAIPVSPATDQAAPLTKTDIRDLQHFFGWSNKEFAMEMDVSVQRISDWLVGFSIPARERAPRLHELFDHMVAEKAKAS